MTVKKKVTTKKKVTAKKKVTVKKKTATKKKATAKKKAAASKATKAVMSHDPLAMIDEVTEEAITAESVTEDDQDMINTEAEAEAEAENSTPDEVQEMSEAKETDVSGTNENSGVDHIDVDLGGSLNIADAEAKKIELAHILDDAVPVRLNGSDIDQCDGAGLQLLAAFFKDAAEKQVDVVWGDVSKMLHDSVTMMGLIKPLKMEDVEIEDDGEGTSWGLF